MQSRLSVVPPGLQSKPENREITPAERITDSFQLKSSSSCLYSEDIRLWAIQEEERERDIEIKHIRGEQLMRDSAL